MSPTRDTFRKLRYFFWWCVYKLCKLKVCCFCSGKGFLIILYYIVIVDPLYSFFFYYWLVDLCLVPMIFSFLLKGCLGKIFGFSIHLVTWFSTSIELLIVTMHWARENIIYNLPRRKREYFPTMVLELS